MLERGRKAGSAALLLCEEGVESKEEERVRGGSREEGDDRSGSLGSGRERVLSSREWMEPTELRGTALAGRGRTEALRSPFLALSLSLSLPLLEIDARAYLERVLGVVSRASAAEGWGEGERESEREEGGVNRRTETRLAEWHSGPRTRRLVLRDDESRRLRADCSTDPLCVRGDRIRVFA